MPVNVSRTQIRSLIDNLGLKGQIPAISEEHTQMRLVINKQPDVIVPIDATEYQMAEYILINQAWCRIGR